MYIRSSPRGPNRDPNRTLSNELLLIAILFAVFFKINLGVLYLIKKPIYYSKLVVERILIALAAYNCFIERL